MLENKGYDAHRESYERARALLAKYGRKIPSFDERSTSQKLSELSDEDIQRMTDYARNGELLEQYAREGKVWAVTSFELLESGDLDKR